MPHSGPRPCRYSPTRTAAPKCSGAERRSLIECSDDGEHHAQFDLKKFDPRKSARPMFAQYMCLSRPGLSLRPGPHGTHVLRTRCRIAQFRRCFATPMQSSPRFRRGKMRCCFPRSQDQAKSACFRSDAMHAGRNRRCDLRATHRH